MNYQYNNGWLSLPLGKSDDFISMPPIKGNLYEVITRGMAWLANMDTHSESSVQNGQIQTDCSSVNQRRLEQGDGAVRFKRRVVKGAFNWRTKYDADGQELECFDYFVNVQGGPVERSAVQATQEIAPHSDVEDFSSSSFGVKLGACAVGVASCFTLGLIIRMLWQRRKKKPTGKPKLDISRRIYTTLRAHIWQTKSARAIKELDGGSNTPAPSFANATTSKAKLQGQ
eukprot:GHVT01085292.1.p2 GENE.GHVT01085292.1~~GHVT01085292.1.p2  ORF type:complete len:228 (+),score=26.40 GHVT01085292.1:1486-2169(+)